MSSRRKPTRRVSGKKPKKRIGIAAKSTKTGLVHVFEFEDLNETEKLSKALKASKEARLETDLVNSLAFWSWLQKQTITDTPNIGWTQPVYRLTYGGFSPVSIVGSVGDGGRFNIGSAQMCPEFPLITKSGCLYTASTLKCCYVEASGPTGKPDEFSLTPTKEFKLWDLTQVITSLNRVGLLDEVKDSPLAGLWVYQKVPKISQLLVHHLRSIGGDGVIFPSTKDQEALNVAFFFRTDDEAKNGFAISKLN